MDISLPVVSSGGDTAQAKARKGCAMSVWYNEINPFAAEWLRNLIDAGLIAPGVVDERSIEDVKPEEIAEYTQCHFFAGIGGWSYALRLAGIPDDFPIWTGSCPCQPFSVAGQGKGFADERHLWPAWFHHICALKPRTIVGEQVERKAGLAWLDLVQTDLEAVGYSVRPAVLPAPGVGAPHERHRIFFMADAESSGLTGRRGAKGKNREEVANGGFMGDARIKGLERHGRDENHAPGREKSDRPVAAAGAGARPHFQAWPRPFAKPRRRPGGQ